jgi:hypothetical protein
MLSVAAASWPNLLAALPPVTAATDAWDASTSISVTAGDALLPEAPVIWRLWVAPTPRLWRPPLDQNRSALMPHLEQKFVNLPEMLPVVGQCLWYC